jgi:anti-anti-sigma factor
MEIIQNCPNPEETIVAFSGKLDFTARKTFQGAIQEARVEGTHHIILDLTDVTFIDCSALGILVQAKEVLAQAQVTLSLMATPGRVLNVLRLSNLDKMIPIISPT